MACLNNRIWSHHLNHSLNIHNARNARNARNTSYARHNCLRSGLIDGGEKFARWRIQCGTIARSLGGTARSPKTLRAGGGAFCFASSQPSD
jgi:hypothetical protein